MSTTTLDSPTVSASDWAHLALDALPDQVYVKDLASRFVLLNAATARFFNRPPATLVGQTDFAFFPTGLAEQFFAEEQALMHSGKAVVNREVQVNDPQGRPRWLLTTKVPLRDSSGEIIGIAGVNRDITSHKIAKDQIRLQATALESAACAAIITDQHGTIDWVNPTFTAMTGYTADEIIGQRTSILKSNHHPQDFYQHLWKTIRAGQQWHDEMVNRRKDGTEYTTEMSITPVHDSNGAISHFVAVQLDTTERNRSRAQLQQLNADLARSQLELLQTYENLKQTQAQLIQAEKLESIGRLAAGVAHEVKNPLAILLMGIGYLEDSVPTGEAATDGVLRDMRDAVERADAIVRELLEYASPRQLETALVDLNSVVDRALRLVQHEINVRHITVVREATPQLPGRRIDRIRIEQVFVNLVMNACQAMPNGGTLTVRTSAHDNDVVVAILDTGSGIPPEALAKIFDPFFTTKAVGVGTGMGLAVAKQILLQHAGDLELTNRPTGGVQATVTFHNGKEHDHAIDRPAGSSNSSN